LSCRLPGSASVCGLGSAQDGKCGKTPWKARVKAVSGDRSRPVGEHVDDGADQRLARRRDDQDAVAPAEPVSDYDGRWLIDVRTDKRVLGGEHGTTLDAIEAYLTGGDD